MKGLVLKRRAMKNRIAWIILVFVIVLMTSCISLKHYDTSDTSVAKDMYFRTDQIPTDSVTLADFTWKEIFTDTILQRYIQTALDSNLDIRAALRSIDISDSYLNQAKVNIWPTLSANPNVTYQTQSQNTQFGQIIGDRVHNVQFGIGLQSSWEIDVWGKLKSQRKLAIANYMQAVEIHQAIKTSLISRVALSYHQLQMLDQQKKILSETIQFRKDYVRSSISLKEAGALTEVAVKQAEAQLLNAESRSISLDYQIEIQENNLHLLMSESPGPIKRSELQDNPIVDRFQVGFPVQLLHNRPDVRQAEYALMAAFEQTNVAYTQFYPTFAITANTGLQSIDFSSLFDPMSFFASLVGGLTQPIFQRKQLKTNHEVALSAQEIAYLDFQSVLLSAVHEVSTALAAYKTQTQIIDLKNQEFEAYALATEYSTALVNNGLGNYLEIILANERALNAKLEYLLAQFSQMQAQIQLYSALGGGWK